MGGALKAISRRTGLGVAAFHLVFGPVGRMRMSLREGGPIEQRRTERGRLAMIAAAAELPPLADPGNPLPLPLNFLSGERYWHQTLFCLVSLQQNIERRVEAVIFDDGSFTEPTRARMLRTMPWLRFVAAEQVAERLDAHLPEARFPSLRHRRIVYPHLRKLTDIHCGAVDWTIVFDSDMLVFRRPDALLDWMQAPAHPIFMQDVASAYGYSDALLEELTGRPVPPRVNVGLYSAHGASIDWDRVEHWCKAQLDREGPDYLQEQALVAMLLADMTPEPLSDADYVVMPSLEEGSAPRAVLHHYVAHSKRSYYQGCWQRVAARAAQAAASDAVR